MGTVQKHCKETPQVAMSSSKTDSSTNKRQKNPEIKIVDTSFGRFKITEETKDTEEDHPNNHDPNVIKKDVKNPLRIRLEYKEGTEDTKFKLTKKKKFESKSHPWIPTPEMKTIREFIEKIQDDYPEASIEIVPLSCEEECFEYYINDKMIYSVNQLKDWPNFDELNEVTYWMYEGKTFMHMYLCSFVEGGDIKMMLYDKRHTPMFKRVMLSCTVM